MKKGKQWCAVAKCMNIPVKKRHFFRFPKEHDRWLQWIRACNRLDLEQKGPKYAYNNCTLCHLHFEDKWFRKRTTLRLHPDAVPTIFYDLVFENTEALQKREENVAVKQEETNQNTCIKIEPITLLTTETNQHEENRKRMPAVHILKSKIENSPRKKKLQLKILKLRKQKKKLQQIVRRLRKKLEQLKRIIKEEEIDTKSIRKLSRLTI